MGLSIHNSHAAEPPGGGGRTPWPFGEAIPWKYGGGSWQAGSVDYENNQIFFGTGNPNPDFDYCGVDCLDVKAGACRPGVNLYTFSTAALDLDAGKLNWYFQEAPSDPYDYDSSPGEQVLFESNGQKLVLHAGKNGFDHVRDRNRCAASDPACQPCPQSLGATQEGYPSTRKRVANCPS